MDRTPRDGLRLAAGPHDLIKHLRSSGPLPFPEHAPVEIHTLVSHDHLPLYLLAVRSLARFWTDPALVVHDDGSLTAADVLWAERTVPAIRVVVSAEADLLAASALARHPTVAAVRATNVRLRQLVDYYLNARADLVIGMDSDIVFLRPPERLIDWAREQDRCFLYSPEWGWQAKGPHWLPGALPGEPFITDICCGLVCVHRPCFFDLDHLESLMSRTPEKILYHGRFVTQMYYSLLGARVGPQRDACLGEPYRSGRLRWLPDMDDRVICHYFASHKRADALQNLVEEDALFREALGLSPAPPQMTINP